MRFFTVVFLTFFLSHFVMAAPSSLPQGFIAGAPSKIGNTTAPDAGATLDVVGSGRYTLINRGTTTDRNAITSPTEGALYFDLTLHTLFQYNGSAWKKLGSVEGSSNTIAFFDNTGVISSDARYRLNGSGQMIISTIGIGATTGNVGAAGTDASFVMGNVAGSESILSTAFGTGGIAFGNSTDGGQISAQGDGSIAGGKANDAGIVTTENHGSIAIGDVDSSGQISANDPGTQAFGYSADSSIIGARGNGSFASGYATGSTTVIDTHTGKKGQFVSGYAASAGAIEVNGDGAFAHGVATNSGTMSAGANGAAVFGYADGSGHNIQAAADGSLAFGRAVGHSIVASGVGSLSGGDAATGDNTASGAGALAFGDGNTSSAKLSTTFGLGNANGSYGAIVGGRYADLTSQTATSWVDTDVLLALGNGASFGAKANAFSVLKNGAVTGGAFVGTSFTGGLIGQVYAPDGAVGTPGVSFSSDHTSGMYMAGAGELGIAVAGAQSLDFKASGSGNGNVGMGGPASVSDNYPLLIQRQHDSAGTYVQISNPSTEPNSSAVIQLATDAGGMVGQISVYPSSSTVPAYISAMVVRPDQNGHHLSLMGGGNAGDDVSIWTDGDFAATGETLRFPSDHTSQLMQSVSSPATPSSGLKFFNLSGVFASKNSSGTVSSFAGTNTGDVSIGTFGSSPDAKGASLSGQAITMQPADGTHPGMLTTGSQTIAGAKTFTGTVAANYVTSATPIPITSGGTNVGVVTTAPTATAFAGWDVNSNLSANSFLSGYATTATAAGTTTLTVSSPQQQFFTGTTTQNVKLPVTSTLALGQSFVIANASTGVVTVQSSGSNTVVALQPNSGGTFTVVATSGTTAASWSAVGSSASPLTTKGDLYVFSTLGVRHSAGSNGDVPIYDSAQADGISNGQPGTTAATASKTALRDSSANLLANNFISGYATTATAASTTTLTVASARQQFFTGTTTQTVALPVTSTMSLGQSFQVVNNSTGIVSVLSSGGNSVLTLPPTSVSNFTVISTSGTTAASWFAQNLTSGASVPPTTTVLTTGSGTYVTKANVAFLKVTVLGGGGGGGGSGLGGTYGPGGNGTASTFAIHSGATLLNSGTAAGSGVGPGGTGGIFTVTSPAIDAGSSNGASGSPGSFATTTVYNIGGDGGGSSRGGGGAAGDFGQAGQAGVAYGSGGGGGGDGGATSSVYSGGGGGASGTAVGIIPSPGVSYDWVCGAAGVGGLAGTSGEQGGDGAPCTILIEENYLNSSLGNGGAITPTVTELLSGSSATYTTPAGAAWLEVTVLGGGGAGGPSGTVTGGTPTSGGTSSFGALSATGGGAGAWASAPTAGGIGSVTSSSSVIQIETAQGGQGGGSQYTNSSTLYTMGGIGGSAGCKAGGNGSSSFSSAGSAGTAYSGAGGGGGGVTGAIANIYTGSGGSGGGCARAIVIPTAGQTFTYTVGAKGNSATAGTSGQASGDGGSGYIRVVVYYNNGAIGTATNITGKLANVNLADAASYTVKANVTGSSATPTDSQSIILGGAAYSQMNSGNSNTTPWLASLDNAAIGSATYGWQFMNDASAGDFYIKYRNGSTTPNTAMQITRSNGHIFVPDLNVTANLRVNTTSNSSVERMTLNFAGNSEYGIYMNDTAGTTGAYMQFYNSGGGQAGSITHAGSNNVAYNTSSDYRLKENIIPMEGALDRLMRLKPSHYDFKYDKAEFDGFIAHELAEIIPFAVTGKKDAIDKDGKPVYQQVDYSKVVPLLTASVQELTKKNEALEKRVEQMEARLKAAGF